MPTLIALLATTAALKHEPVKTLDKPSEPALTLEQWFDSSPTRAVSKLSWMSRLEAAKSTTDVAAKEDSVGELATGCDSSCDSSCDDSCDACDSSCDDSCDRSGIFKSCDDGCDGSCNGSDHGCDSSCDGSCDGSCDISPSPPPPSPSPPPPPAGWYVSELGSSCTATCTKAGNVCTKESMYSNALDTADKFNLALEAAGQGLFACTHDTTNYGDNANVPCFATKSDFGTFCALSDTDRAESTYDCDTAAPSNAKRMCYCDNGH